MVWPERQFSMMAAITITWEGITKCRGRGDAPQKHRDRSLRLEHTAKGAKMSTWWGKSETTEVSEWRFKESGLGPGAGDSHGIQLCLQSRTGIGKDVAVSKEPAGRL